MKNQIIISTHTEKVFAQTQGPFITKVLKHQEQKIISQHKLATYNETIATNILSVVKLKIYPLNQDWDKLSTITILFNILLEILARAIRQEKEIRVIQIGNEGVKSSVSEE